MQLPSLFKTYKNRQFTYKPVFYDRVKDKLNERISKAEKEMANPAESKYSISLTRGSIRKHSKLKSKTLFRSNFRLAVITLILLAIAYYLLYK